MSLSRIDAPERVLLCSGKIYYDLVAERARREPLGPAILRLEQFYPFPFEQVKQVAGRWQAAGDWFWVQEEPENMGGWNFIGGSLREATGREIRYLGRRPAASPAAGYHSLHKSEQATIVAAALGT